MVKGIEILYKAFLQFAEGRLFCFYPGFLIPLRQAHRLDWTRIGQIYLSFVE